MGQENQPQEADNITTDVEKIDPKMIFEERFEDIMNDFGKKCEEISSPVAIAIVIHPDEEQPLVFIRGEEYEAARVMAFVLKKLKQEIISQLNV